MSVFIILPHSFFLVASFSFFLLPSSFPKVLDMIDDDAVEEMQEMDQDLDTMDIDMKERTDHAMAADVLRSLPLGHTARPHRSRALRAVDGGTGIELKRRIDGGGGRGGGDDGGGDFVTNIVTRT